MSCRQYAMVFASMALRGCDIADATVAVLDVIPVDASKSSLRTIDFVDTGHPALLRMWEKRQRGYRAMGYRIAEPSA